MYRNQTAAAQSAGRSFVLTQQQR